MEEYYKVKIKNLDYEFEVESSDKAFVEAKLKIYVSTKIDSHISLNDFKGNSSKPDAPVLPSLARFLKDNDATMNQNKKFLGAAVYLYLKGKKSMSTSEINSALKDAGQVRLRNASECLNQNVKKGLIEKTSKNEFMVTVHGREEMGIES